MRLIATIVLSAVMLCGCGQKGPLYLPAGVPPPPPPAATPANLPPGAQTPITETPDAGTGVRQR